MKNDKFCFNRTLGYLVLLVLVVVGFFWVMNGTNQDNKTTKSEASGLVCTDPGVSGNPANGCYVKANTFVSRSGTCLKYTGCQYDNGGCQTSQATYNDCSPSKASCTSKLPDRVTANPCWVNNTTPTYQKDASGTLCLKNTACVKADGQTCSTQAVSMNLCTPPQSSCKADLPDGTTNPCFVKADTFETVSGTCIKYSGCVKNDGVTCWSSQATYNDCSPSKASCTSKLPDRVTANPCWVNNTTPTYQKDASGTLCLKNTACVKADGQTCSTQAVSMNLCNPASKASCTSKLPDKVTANPCWVNNTTPTYKWDTSETVCLKNTACVKADGSTCSTQVVSTQYCPKPMWLCNTSGVAGSEVCEQTVGNYANVGECQAALSPSGNNGLCFTSSSVCTNNCP